ncbi:MAG: hypothetical protein NTZ16_07360 [Verrucomicrobia bacterium]|nr:hypothetical protein [Verrucomicrobiota bacterium]
MKPLYDRKWPWLLAGIIPPLFGLLLLLVVGPEGGPGTMALFLCVDAVGSVCLGIGVARFRKPDGSPRIGAAVLAGIGGFVFGVVFLVFAGASMFGL